MEPKRNTIQRALVLEAVRALQCHATADEVYRLIAQKHPTISKATVYRNLNQLAEAKEIRKMTAPGGVERYDHIPIDHYHVHCAHCNRIYDVEMAYMPDLECRITDAHGFSILGHDILFHGVCPDCRQQSHEE